MVQLQGSLRAGMDEGWGEIFGSGFSRLIWISTTSPWFGSDPVWSPMTFQSQPSACTDSNQIWCSVSIYSFGSFCFRRFRRQAVVFKICKWLVILSFIFAILDFFCFWPKQESKKNDWILTRPKKIRFSLSHTHTHSLTHTCGLAHMHHTRTLTLTPHSHVFTQVHCELVFVVFSSVAFPTLVNSVRNRDCSKNNLKSVGVLLLLLPTIKPELSQQNITCLSVGRGGG